jgi:hypothetical protein
MYCADSRVNQDFLENQLQKFDIILGIRVLEIKQNCPDKFVEGVQGMNVHIYSRPSLLIIPICCKGLQLQMVYAFAMG